MNLALIAAASFCAPWLLAGIAYTALRLRGRPTSTDTGQDEREHRIRVEQLLQPDTIAWANGRPGRTRVYQALAERTLTCVGVGGSGSDHVEGGTEEIVCLEDTVTGETIEIAARRSTGGYAHLLVRTTAERPAPRPPTPSGPPEPPPPKDPDPEQVPDPREKWW